MNKVKAAPKRAKRAAPKGLKKAAPKRAKRAAPKGLKKAAPKRAIRKKAETMHRSASMIIRITPEQLALLKETAALEGLTISDFVRVRVPEMEIAS